MANKSALDVLHERMKRNGQTPYAEKKANELAEVKKRQTTQSAAVKQTTTETKTKSATEVLHERMKRNGEKTYAQRVAEKRAASSGNRLASTKVAKGVAKESVSKTAKKVASTSPVGKRKQPNAGQMAVQRMQQAQANQYADAIKNYASKKPVVEAVRNWDENGDPRKKAVTEAVSAKDSQVKLDREKRAAATSKNIFEQQTRPDWAQTKLAPFVDTETESRLREAQREKEREIQQRRERALSFLTQDSEPETARKPFYLKDVGSDEYKSRMSDAIVKMETGVDPNSLDGRFDAAYKAYSDALSRRDFDAVETHEAELVSIQREIEQRDSGISKVAQYHVMMPYSERDFTSSGEVQAVIYALEEDRNRLVDGGPKYGAWSPVNDDRNKNIAILEKKIAELTPILEKLQAAERQALIDSGEYRHANLYDITIGAGSQMYNSMKLGKEYSNQMLGIGDDVYKYEQLLASDKYKYIPDNKFEEWVAAVSGQIGQYVEGITTPEVALPTLTAAGAAFALGNAGPQAGIPEEVITVPSAAGKAFSAAMAVNIGRVESGFAYKEMLDAGISENTARKIALGVGVANAALEGVSLDALGKSFKILSKNAATKGFSRRLFMQVLREYGVNLLTQVGQEATQEAVTFGGTQLGSKIDKGEWAYTAEDFVERELQTLEQSFMSFSVLGAGNATVGYVFSKINQNNILSDPKVKKAVDDVKSDPEKLTTIIEEGKLFDDSTKAAQTAKKVEQDIAEGKEVSDKDVAELIVENSREYVTANADFFVNDEEKLNALIEEGQSIGGKSLKIADDIAYKVSKGTEVTREDVQRLMEGNQRAYTKIARSEYESLIKKVAGYGKHGMKTLSDMRKTIDAETTDLALEFDAPYQAGRLNQNESTVKLDTQIAREAYNAGVQDYLDQVRADSKHRASAVYTSEASQVDWTHAPSDITPKQKRGLEFVSKVFGVQVGFSKDETRYNANYDPNTGRVEFDAGFGINPNLLEKFGDLSYIERVEKLASKRGHSLTFYIAHEIATHRAMDLAPTEMRAFVNAMYTYKQSKENGTNLARGKQDFYLRQGESLSTEVAFEEVVADSILDLYDGDEQAFFDAIERIANGTDMNAKKGARTFLEWLSDTIERFKAWAKTLTGKAKASAEKDISSLEELRNMFEKAIATGMKTVAKTRAKGRAVSEVKTAQKNTAAKSGVKYSVKRVNGKQIVWIENSGLSAKQLKSHTAVANYIAQHIGEVYTIIESGQKVYIGDDLPSEFTQSEYTKTILKRMPAVLAAKNRAISDLGLLIETATGRKWEETKHPQSKDAKYGMYRYKSSFAFPVRDGQGKTTDVHAYDVKLVIRNASDGKKYLYDIVNIKRNTSDAFDLQQRETRKSNLSVAPHGSVSKSSVSPSKPNVKQNQSTQNGTTTKSNIKASIKGTLIAAGLDAVKDENGRVIVSIGGKQVKSVTSEHIRDNSAMGGLIKQGCNNGFITEQEAEEQYKLFADIVNMIIKTEDPELVWAWTGSALFSAVKSNADGQYGTTIDFTTICRKTQDMITAMSNSMMRLKRGLTKAEITELQRELLAEGSSVPCPVCYVFSRWAGVGSILDNMSKWQSRYDAYTDEQLQKRIEELTEKLGKGKTKDLTAMLRAQDEEFARLSHEKEQLAAEKKDLNKEKRKHVRENNAHALASVNNRIAEVEKQRAKVNGRLKEIKASVAPELAWLTQVRVAPDYKQHGKVPSDVLFNLNDAATFAEKYPLAWKYRSTRGPGAGKAILPYSDMQLGDIILGVGNTSADGNSLFENATGEFTAEQKAAVDKAIARTKAQNLIGGQRFQSTSDFRYDYALDYLMAFLECQAIGSFAQTYSKIIEFGDMVAAVGGDFNLSVMPKNKGYITLPNGKNRLVFSSVTGISFEAAVRSNQMYDNGQLILVGINDEHILAALEDSEETLGENIGFVIPYHASGASINEFIRVLVSNLGESYMAKSYMDYSDVQTDKENGKATAAQKRRNDLRTKLLKGKDGAKNWEPTAEDLKFIRGESVDISDRSFAELRAIERKALHGDKAAIAEYESWTSGALQNLYEKLWSNESSEYHGVRLNSAQAKTVMPHEYWNKSVGRDKAYINGFLFRSYCYNLGLSPRFTGVGAKGTPHGDFSDSKGYWKLLIDRPMYNNDGTYRDQQRVNVTKLQKEMLTPSYAKTNWEGYAVQEPSAERASRAADRFVAQKNTTAESGVDSRKQKIEVGMSDETRYELLKDRSILISHLNAEKLAQIEQADYEALRGANRGNAFTILRKIGEQFGIFKDYSNPDVDIEFGFSKRKLSESVNKQKKEYHLYAQLLTVFDDVVEAAVGIEVHENRYDHDGENVRETYVLVSGFETEGGIVPVLLEVRVFKDNTKSSLHVVVSLQEIKRSRIVVYNNTAVSDNAPYTLPASKISIAEMFKNVNAEDGQLLKYIPDGFLDERQMVAKQEAIRKQEEYVAEKNARKHSLKGEEEFRAEVNRIREAGKKAGKSDAEIRQDVMEVVNPQYAELLKEFGAYGKGEKASREIEVPKKSDVDRQVSQTVRTILEAEVTPDTLVPQLEEMVATGDFSYDVFGDKSAMDGAKRTIRAKSYSEALADWYNAVDSGKVNKANAALGWELYNQAANAGDGASAINILNRMVGHQRDAAQALQATRILKKLSPDAQLYSAVKEVQKFEEDLKKEFHKFDGIKIDETLAEEFMRAETQEERDRIMKEIYRDIGRQMPASWKEKFTAWKYMAMLANPRTHIRNIGGNAFFTPVVLAKNLTATAIESAVDFVARKTTGKSIGRTKGRVKSDLLKAAWEDFANVEDIVMGGGKYNDTANANRYIEEGRRIYTSKVGKVAEAVRRGNSKALDREDMWFSKPHYAYALAQYCSANGITAEQLKRGKALGNAREYAIREAQKATYRDANAFSEMVGNLGRRRNANSAEKALGTVISGVLPFRKTPANILVRGVEYSPAGLLKGLTYDLVMVAKGEKTAAEAIDQISAGLTGTGLLALGVFLAAQGLVRGAGGSDEDEKKFEELQGHQAYSLELPNGMSITLDWLAPEALPFFVGVNLCEIAKEGNGGATLSDILSAVTNITDPMLEMSCLQSLNDIFDSLGYANENETSALLTVLVSAITSHLTQYVPTILGQFERSTQRKRMTTYTEKDNWLTGDMQYTLGRTSARVLGWDFGQIPYIDAWGREERTDNPIVNAANNFLNPAYMSEVESSAMERELARLYDSTGEAKVLPQRADKYFTVDKERKDLTSKEYVTYAKEKGQAAYDIVSDLVGERVYKRMSDEDKASAVSMAYEYANAVAKTKVDKDYEPQSWVANAIEAKEDIGMDETTYILYQTAMASLTWEKGKTGAKKAAVVELLNGLGLSRDEYDYLYHEVNNYK